jgi:hypothetical protein
VWTVARRLGLNRRHRGGVGLAHRCTIDWTTGIGHGRHW